MTTDPRLTFTISQETLDALTDFRFEKKFKNQSQAIRALVEKGLEIYMPERNQTSVSEQAMQLAADYDALAVPGGFEEFGFYEEAYDEKFQNLVRDFHQMGKPIASVCVAALALGRSGILQGRRATTYHLRGGHRQAQLAALGADVVPDQRVVADGNVITSYCPETAADVAFALLEMLIGAEKAGAVRQDMGY